MKTGWLKFVVVFILAVVSGGSLMVVSHSVQQVQRQIMIIERAIAHEQEAIRVLQAEWSYLNDPQRLDVLASRYLNLFAPSSVQLVSHVDAVKPVLSEEEVTQGIEPALIHEAGFTPSQIIDVVSAAKPVSFRTSRGRAP